MDMQPASIKEPLAYRDELIRGLNEKLGLDQLPPEQRMAKLMALGAPVTFKNYVNENIGQNTTPTLITGEDSRRYILVTGNVLGPRISVDGMNFGIANALPIEGTTNLDSKSGKQYMVPQPHCERSERIVGASEQAKAAGIRKLDFITIGEKQMGVIQQLMKQATPATPNATPVTK